MGNRLAGWVLAIGALTIAASIMVYTAQYAAPEGTGPGDEILPVDRLRNYLNHQLFLNRLWLAESAGVLLVFAAGCFVQNERTAPGWRLARGGLVLLLIQYALMLYGYPPAAEYAAHSTGMFVLMNELAWTFFLMGNGLMMLGFAAVFFGAASGRAMPGIAARIAGVLALLGGAAALAAFTGLRGTAPAEMLLPFAAALSGFSLLFMAAYGVGVSRTR